VDEIGREVPVANNMINFKVSGPAIIIGVGNGDPSSHEADKIVGNWQRSAFNGKCQVIIQSGKTAGNLQLVVTSNGLREANISIPIKAIGNLKPSGQLN
jgi:beta-galactosidase